MMDKNNTVKKEAEAETKTTKEKFHDYMMDLSKISPSGLTDDYDEYYFHVKYN